MSDIPHTPATNADKRGLINAAQAALTNNQAFLDNGSPTNAQVLAQVRALTQQVSALIRRAIQIV